jgi:spore coat assembly protein SafA
MKKLIISILLIAMLCLSIFAIMQLSASGNNVIVEAQSAVHTVQKGDSMWKIAVRYETGLSEIIKANPHIQNPALIYPGQKIYIPETAPLKSVESEISAAGKC